MLQRDLAPGVHRVEHAYTNFYVVEDGDAVTIVDAGLPRSWRLLQSALSELGRRPEEVEALIVTHGHADHVGCADRMRTEWDVPVWLHERDRSLSRHPLSYEKEHSPLRHARHGHALRVALALGAAGALQTKGVGEVRAFDDEDELDVPGRPRPVPTPGHTHGHTAFHLPDRDVLIAGDALTTHDPYNGRRGAFIMSGASNADSAQALASLQRIADTDAGIVAVGHGEPWTRGAAAAVQEAREHGPS